MVVHAYEEHGLDCVPPPERHLRLRALGRPRAATRGRATSSASSRSTGARTGAARLRLASEIGALIAADMVRPAVDRVALDHYLLACRFVPSPRTLFEGVSKLPPASTLVVPRRQAAHRELACGPGPAFAGGSDDELARQLIERFSDAVERQMMSDVPYGAFLSGRSRLRRRGGGDGRARDGAADHVLIGFPGRRRARRARTG